MIKLQRYAFPMQKDIQIAYSLTKHPNLEEGRRTFDVCYELAKVFNVDFYRKAKNYKKHVRLYLETAEELGYHVREIQSEKDYEAVYSVYDAWNNSKLEADKANPNHYTEHSARYKYCLDCVRNHKLETGKIIGMFDKVENLLSYQMYTTDDNWVFGCTTASLKLENIRVSNIATVMFLKWFADNGFEFANWGECGGDPKLLEYKEAFPNFRIYHGKLNLTFEKSTEADISEIVEFMKANSSDSIPFPTDYMPETIKAGNVTKAIVDGKLAGMVELRHRAEGPNLMTNLITSPEFRGQGIAEKLLNQLDKPFIWNCYKHNETANRFYSNLENVRRTGETPDGKSYSYVRVNA